MNDSQVERLLEALYLLQEELTQLRAELANVNAHLLQLSQRKW